jgi:hypothetical protein
VRPYLAVLLAALLTRLRATFLTRLRATLLTRRLVAFLARFLATLFAREMGYGPRGSSSSGPDRLLIIAFSSPYQRLMSVVSFVSDLLDPPSRDIS